ncbi:LAME_0H04346g1_1 [Lachancea meyersii CBS 8951]|uniref:LAME_0H04346g1_1 n=1 Tax=Lachancea meyersii CBS 8951 TaxID=1266667 RepID=A0A1G4KDV5_9SACH|nr:LAME_0H04346g1_1 [Lachancea meyersii CBS 8951]
MNRHTKKGPWTSGEDQALLSLVRQLGPQNWVRIAAALKYRSPKQCRERYHQNLKPSLNKQPISEAEGALIEDLVARLGKKWAEIARVLNNGRSDNAVKNWWNGGANKRLRARGTPGTPGTPGTQALQASTVVTWPAGSGAVLPPPASASASLSSSQSSQSPQPSQSPKLRPVLPPTAPFPSVTCYVQQPVYIGAPAAPAASNRHQHQHQPQPNYDRFSGPSPSLSNNLVEYHRSQSYPTPPAFPSHSKNDTELPSLSPTVMAQSRHPMLKKDVFPLSVDRSRFQSLTPGLTSRKPEGLGTSADGSRRYSSSIFDSTPSIHHQNPGRRTIQDQSSIHSIHTTGVNSFSSNTSPSTPSSAYRFQIPSGSGDSRLPNDTDLFRSNFRFSDRHAIQNLYQPSEPASPKIAVREQRSELPAIATSKYYERSQSRVTLGDILNKSESGPQ